MGFILAITIPCAGVVSFAGYLIVALIFGL